MHLCVLPAPTQSNTQMSANCHINCLSFTPILVRISQESQAAVPKFTFDCTHTGYWRKKNQRKKVEQTSKKKYQQTTSKQDGFLILEANCNYSCSTQQMDPKEIIHAMTNIIITIKPRLLLMPNCINKVTIQTQGNSNWARNPVLHKSTKCDSAHAPQFDELRNLPSRLQQLEISNSHMLRIQHKYMIPRNN